MDKKNFFSAYNIVIIIALVILIIAAFYDLKISTAWYVPQSKFSSFFRDFGEFPAYFCCSWFLIMFLRDCIDRKRKLVLSIFIWVMLVFLLTYTNHKFFSISFLHTNEYVISFIISIIIIPVLLFALEKMSKKVFERLFIIFFVGALIVVFSNVAVQIVKLMWGRVRFRDLNNNFTAWYLPNWYTGDKSFPSGHTSAAANILFLTLIPNYFKAPRAAKFLIYIFCGFWIVATAFSRINLGAHYLSDVTVGFLISFITFIIVKNLFLKKYEKAFIIFNFI